MTKYIAVLIIVAAAAGYSFFGNGMFGNRALARNSSGSDARQRKARTASTFTTSSNRRLEPQTALVWHPVARNKRQASAKSTDVQATIVVDTSKQYQSITGFGGAFTDAACYMFNGMPQDSRTLLFKELFDSSHMGLNLCRACMGSSDYATHVYSYCDEPDMEMKNFSIDHDRKYILPMIRETRAINPDIFLFASPWSPPGWMKSSKSMLGGNMQRKYLKPYALYFLRFLQDYAKEGVPVQAVTVQNEVDTDQDGLMPACAWPQELEVDFVRHDLGPLLKKNGIDTRIWIIDHNYNLWGRALGSLDTEGLKDYVDAIAWHGYVGDAQRISTVHDAYPDVSMYWTEGGPDYTDPNYAKDWAKWARTFTTNLRNWCRGITVWNLALDETGHPNIGPFPCGGLVTINSKTKAVSYSGQYFALGHFSRFVKRGAKCVKSAGDNSTEVAHVAFVNPDGQKVLVVTNGGQEQRIGIQCDEQQLELTLEPDSVTTVLWQ